MKISVAVALTLGASAVGLAAYIGEDLPESKHYSADELVELSCEALGERHEEVIVAYHDAEIAHRSRTGTFHDDLGLPTEDVLPYAVLIKRFVRDHDIGKAETAGAWSSMPILSSGFYHEVSAICATNPSWQATDAMRQAALNLSLIEG